MKTIILKDILAVRSYPEAGDYIFNDIKDCIINNDKVVFDMSEVMSVPTMFLNTSFGAIIDEFGVQKLKSSISFRNISKTQIDRIQKYINDYYQTFISNNLNN